MHEIVRKETSILMIMVTGLAVIVMVFFAMLIYEMTGYVGVMAKGMETMSTEMVALNKRFELLADNMIIVNGHMAEMNVHMKDIQADMARDISSMSSSVKSMSEDMGSMKKDMNGFSSPRGFMRNFRP